MIVRTVLLLMLTAVATGCSGIQAPLDPAEYGIDPLLQL